MKKGINAIQEKITADINAIKCVQAEFEEKNMVKLDKELNAVVTAIEQQTQKHREFNSDLGVTRRDIEVAQGEIEATQHDPETHLAAVEGRTTHTGCRSTGCSKKR
jgi:septal ring factor EnvC (AmiA/AmiB activator)